MVLITQGPDPIIVVTNGETQEFSVPPLEKIEDTNGAGDAFCGGIKHFPCLSIVNAESFKCHYQLAYTK